MSGESAYVYGFEVALAAVLVVVALVTALARRIGIPNFVPGQMAEAGQRLPRVIDNNGIHAPGNAGSMARSQRRQASCANSCKRALG